MKGGHLPTDTCRDCGEPMTDHTKSSLKARRCRPCYNIWFKDWVERRAAEGKLTGRRAIMNKPFMDERQCWLALRWRVVA